MFLYKLSKDLLLCCSSSFFFHLLYLFLINLCNTLLPNDRVHAISVDIGNIIKSTPVIDRVIEVEIAPIITIVSTVSKIVLDFFNFFIIFWISGFVFIFGVCDHFLMLLIELLKVLTSVKFFSNRRSNASFSNGADGFMLSHFLIYLYSTVHTQFSLNKALFPCETN